MALTRKQQAFVDEYLHCFNASEAARRAGYSERTAYAIGWENLRKPEISQVIEQRLRASAMSADEALMRLAAHARGDMGDFITIAGSEPAFDFQAAALGGKLHLVKKLRTRSRTYTLGRGEDAAEVTEVNVEVELYDAQSALTTILKAHGEIERPRGTETDPVVNVNLTLDEWRQAQAERQKLAAETLAAFADEDV